MKWRAHVGKWMRVAALATMMLPMGCDKDESSEGPAAPSELKATVLNGAVQLTWKDHSTDEVHFMVFRRLTSEAASAAKEIAAPPANATVYDDASVMVGASYAYKVQSMDVEGAASAFSNEVEITVN